MTEQALLFADVVDSTQLGERLGDARTAVLWAEHDRLARALLASHRGREIERTDGFFLLFARATDAAAFALGYHDALDALGLQARVGLHVGSVALRENSAADVARGAKPVEVEGRSKPFAARVMALARGGQTLLSAAARAALVAVPDAAEVASHGHYRLKGIDAPVEIFELGRRGRAAFAPPPDADKAYRVTADGALWRPRREIATNVGAERDAFVGRTAELRALSRDLEDGVRLVNVTGAGGSGKTRLVRRYARAWLGDWPGGAWFCDLSEASTPDGILFAVATALGVPLKGGDPVAQLGRAIAARGRCLVVLDNFEQVVPFAAATLGAWLDGTAEAAFVVTSRERLHLPGEKLLALEPLALASEAVELFEVRARAQRPDFAAGPANRAAIEEIVRVLDGLPLAIELAAARLRVLSPAQLVQRLNDRFSVLASAPGSAGRQATMRATIDWSWHLLAPWEQAALAQCSVFEGGFTLAAADAVLDLSSWPDAPPVVDAVQSLVDKSLLRSWVHGSARRVDIDEPWFGMYLSIREYAGQQLRAEPGTLAAAAERRHGVHFAGFGSTEALEALRTHGGVQRGATLAFELDNLVAACRRALARADAAVAAATFRAAWAVLDLQGPFASAVELGVQLWALDGLDDGLRATIAAPLASALRRVGRHADARAHLEQALPLARGALDRRTEGTVLLGLGTLDSHEGRVAEGTERMQAAVAIARQTGARRMEGAALSGLAVLHHDVGRLEQARADYNASLAMLREVGDRYAEGVVLGNLATLDNDQGRLDEARALYQMAIAVCREVGDRDGEAVTLGNLGKLELDLNRLDEARSALEEGLRIGRQVGSRRNEGVILGLLGIVLQRLGDAGAARSHHERALAIAREIGNRRFAGQSLTNLGELASEQGDAGRAAELLVEAEALLRSIDDSMDLAELLCLRGIVDLRRGDRIAASAALAEAEAIASALAVGPASGLGQGLARLRAAVAQGAAA